MDLSKLINGKTMIFVAIACTLTLAMMACAGQDFGDFVKVKTPTSIQQSKGLPATLSLNDSEYEFAAWFDDVARDGNEWKNRISNGRNTASLFKSLSMQIGQEVQANPAVAAVPGLALLIGLFIRKPGDVSPSENAAEKEASYNKSRRDVLTELETRAKTTPQSDQTAAELIALIKKGVQAST